MNPTFSKSDILTSVVNTYNYHSRSLQRSSHIELEIKLMRIDSSTFSAIYKKAISQKYAGVLEQSLAVIQDIDEKTVNRQDILFKNGEKLPNPISIRKTRIMDKFVDGVKISISKEDQLRNFNPSSANKFRFKFRSSIILDSDKNWRIDFTITKLVEKNSAEYQNLQSVKSKFFALAPKTRIPNFLQNLDTDVTDTRTEIEFEWIGPSRGLSADSIGHYISDVVKPLSNESESPESDATYQQLLFIIASKVLSEHSASEFRSNFTLKNLASRPKSFTRDTFKKSVCSNISNYFISDKADGIRSFIIFADETVMVMFPNSVDMFSKGVKTGHTFTVCDAEVLVNKDKSIKKIYLFDTLIFANESVVDSPTSERFELVKKSVKSLPSKLASKISIKTMTEITESGKEISDMFSRKRDYPIDGLVFTENAPYFKMQVLKWKPEEKQTIDFLLKSPPANLIGIKPYIPRKGFKMYWLFNGVNERTKRQYSLETLPGYYDLFNKRIYPNLGKKGYYPVQFSVPDFPMSYLYYSDSEENLDGRVVELGKNPDSSFSDDKSIFPWKFHSIREDKEIEVAKGTNYGNSYQVALHTFNEIMNPISIKELADLCSSKKDDKVSGGDEYFKTQKKDLFKPGVKFNSFVVAQLIRSASGSDSVVDLAAGRGNHLWTYNGFGIKHGIFLDIDKDAIHELKNRIEKLDDPKLYIYNRKPEKNMKISTAVVDLTQNYSKTIAEIERLSAFRNIGDSSNAKLSNSAKSDAVIITFAIHYLIKNEESLVNFFKLVDLTLAPGGLFMFTCFNGEMVFELLKPYEEGQSWDYKAKSGEIQYSIKKLYKSKKFEEFGQKIAVTHPFSAGEYYEEYLVNIDAIVSKFVENGYEVQQNGSFGDWLPKFQRFNTDMYYKMTDGDKLYCSLYQYVTLRKK